VRGRAAPPGLAGYYTLEGLNALGTNVFFLGVFFHARLAHGFTDGGNLALAAAQGAAYVLATRTGGRLADRIGPDRSIALGLGGMCLALLAGWRLPQAWALFATMAAYSAATALTWPALEAAIAHGPDRAGLARRAGLYNIVWSAVGAAGFFASGSLFAVDPDTVFLVPLAAHALELLGLAASAAGISRIRLRASASERLEERHQGLVRRGGLHRAQRSEHAGGPQRQDPGETVPGERNEGVARRGGLHRAQRSEHGRQRGLGAGGPQRQDPEGNVHGSDRARFLRAAWVANGLGYFLFGAFSALAPTLGARLGLGPRLAIWMVSAYLFARSGVFVLFWAWSGWAYRRAWIAAALLLPPAALAVAFWAAAPAVVIAALAVLGAMSGVAYSASLHASLDREENRGEGGGLHERIIGVGVLFGPLAGAAGAQLLGGTAGAGGLVAALGVVAALGGVAPLLRKAP
jgi:MFS family permease